MRAALAPQVKLHEVWAWSMYDFANSGYTTVVITAVFGAYFVGVVAAGKARAPLPLAAAPAGAYSLVLVFRPPLGALAPAAPAQEKLRPFFSGGRAGFTP